MIARRKAEGVDPTARAAVQRIMPKVYDADERGTAPGFIRMAARGSWRSPQ